MNLRASLALMGCVALLGGCEVSDLNLEPLSLEQAVDLQKQTSHDPRAALFIDPRDALAFESGHIPGAANLTLVRFDGEQGKNPGIARFNELVVYGANPGDPSVPAVGKRLIAIGYTRVRVFPGGLSAWSESGLPTETGAGRTLPSPEQPRRGSAR
ncbi:MAG: rhodanese-like domain-containing protein [Planctomycetes bacterium]|nr:rhodanese-like domain-containing protein [Planctomycetota bacterium]